LKEVYKFMELQHYHLISALYDYPSADFPEDVQKVLTYLQEHYPQAAKEVDAFYVNLPMDNLDRMQELFTRTFDVQAITTLDVGYVLFGDDYKRGELLANLNREHKQVKNDCGCELADHLPNILRLIPELDDQELIEEIIVNIIVPALEKMIAEFDPNRLVKKDDLYKKHYKTVIETSKNNSLIYCHILKALNIILRKDFNIKKQAIQSDQSRDFLKSVREELVIEKI